MIFRHGGLTFIRHNELQDLTAEWLQEVCHDVTAEPPLLPLNGELITPSSANCSNAARADIHARGFWGRRQGALFDVRVSIPMHQVIVRPGLLPFFVDTSSRRSENMGIVYVMLTVNLSPRLFFQRLVVWARRLLFSTTVWQIF